MVGRGFLLAVIFVGLAGCASYTTPGGAADFSQLGLTAADKAALTDKSVQQILEKKPLVTFPVTMAVARVQAGDYDSYSYHRYAPMTPRGKYSVITVRDVEKEEDFEALGKLPEVAGTVGVKGILLHGAVLNSDLALREAAAKLHANLLLYYTFDTVFETETHIAPLGVITLGLAPNKMAKVTSTASAVLMDVNNGYVYAVMEATATDDQLTNAWESSQAMDDARKKAEREAFVKLMGGFKGEWGTVVRTYDKRVRTAAEK